MGKIIKLPKHSRVKRSLAKQLQQSLDDYDLPVEARALLDNTLYAISDNPGEREVFVMVTCNQLAYITKEITKCREVATTFTVWNYALSKIRQDTGEVMATRDELAKEIGISPNQITNAMTALENIGAIIKQKRGRNVVYVVNANVAWNGKEGARIKAASKAPKLTLIKNDIEPVANHIAKRATDYLMSADYNERLKWSEKAIENGFTKIKASTALSNVPKWSRYVALDLVKNGDIDPDL